MIDAQSFGSARAPRTVSGTLAGHIPFSFLSCSPSLCHSATVSISVLSVPSRHILVHLRESCAFNQTGIRLKSSRNQTGLPRRSPLAKTGQTKIKPNLTLFKPKKWQRHLHSIKKSASICEICGSDPTFKNKKPSQYVPKIGKVKQGKASILTPPGGGRPFYTPYVPAWERKFLYFQPFYPCSNCSIHVIFNPQNLRFSPAKLSTLNSPSSQPFNSIPMLDARLDPPHSGS